MVSEGRPQEERKFEITPNFFLSEYIKDKTMNKKHDPNLINMHKMHKMQECVFKCQVMNDVQCVIHK